MKKQWTILGAVALLSLALTACGETAKTETTEREPWHTVAVKEAVELTSTEEEVDTDLLVGDVNGDGVINTKDVVLLRKYVANIDPETGESTVELGKHTHKEGEWIVDKEATCVETGTKHQICATCKATIKTETIALTDHTVVIDEAVSATTEKTGLTEGSHCSVCGLVIKAQETTPVLKASTGLTYTSYGDGTCYVSGIGTCKDTDIVIPSVSPDGDSVTSIGLYAFPDCRGLTSVTIPDSVTYIGDLAFSDCSDLTSVTIPDSVTYIGYGAFLFAGLTSIEIPDSVTYIGEQAFCGCTGLTSVKIGNGVTFIGGYAFRDCTGLTSITVDSGNTKYYSVENCVIETATKTLILGFENSVIPSDGSVTCIGDSAFYRCTGLTSIEIPNSVTSIGESAFYCCTGLTSIEIPDSVTSIGNYAFYGCTGLTSVTILDSVTSIGDCAFYYCTGLTDVYYDGTEAQWAVITIGTNNTYLTGATIHYLGEKTASEGLYFTSNGDGTCSVSDIGTCKDTDIVVPSTSPAGDRVTSIGDWAFAYCTGLTSVEISDSVTSIGEYVFAQCTGLTSITVDSDNNVYHSAGNCLIETATKTLVAGCQNSVIPTDGSVTSIGEWAFSDCTGLASVEIPDSVTSIGEYAFYDCTGLTSIVYGGTKAQWSAVTKDSDWNSYTGSYTIHCTDGDLSK